MVMLSNRDVATAYLELAQAVAAADQITPEHLTNEEVATWTRSPETDADLTRVVQAVNEFIAHDCPDVSRHDDGSWDAATKLGATMLAVRWLRRRNSPNGVEAMTDAGASYISRYDSDMARLLRIDGYHTPKVG
jgi:hypothetical protein